VYCCRVQPKNPDERQTVNPLKPAKTCSLFALTGHSKSWSKDSGPRIHQCNPRSRLPTLNATIHRYQTRYQPGSLKSNRSSRHKTCLWRTLTVGEESICYLFFSTNYFSTPPGGMSKQKKSFT